VLPAGASAQTWVERLPNDLAKLRRFCEHLAAQGELRTCHEASGAGYVIHRALTGWRYHCDVIAPSLIPTKPGVQRTHDKHDAVQLARLYCVFRPIPFTDFAPSRSPISVQAVQSFRSKPFTHFGRCRSPVAVQAAQGVTR